MKIKPSWYLNDDVQSVAKMLLGKMLCTSINEQTTKGLIVETEAYAGYDDKACHANGQRMTARNKVMFEAGGHAYIYLCYGIHHLFNIVTNRQGRADAVLVRAIEPVEGLDVMLVRRKMTKIEKRLTSGPGMLTQALGIKTHHYGIKLDSDVLWIEETQNSIQPLDIVSTTRIGVDYAEDDALKPWRFYMKGNPWVSKL